MRITAGPFVAILLILSVVPVLGQQPGAPTPVAPESEFKNLKVLPKDIPPAELRGMMNGFTRALGVRCIYCHVGEEGKPFRAEDFQKDDKPTKDKARRMIEMVRDLNEKYLAGLEHRADPPIRIECATCHRGVPQPRSLQAVLQQTYATGGLDSTLARYRAMRARWYGRAAYDFGEVTLADVGGAVARGGHAADAESLLALNVSVNPASTFAKRQLAAVSIRNAFLRSPAEGASATAAARADLGKGVINEDFINGIGYDLLGAGQVAAALSVLHQNVTDFPASGNAFDSYGEVLAAAGDRKGAIAAYTRSIELDPANDNAVKKLAELKHPARKGSNAKK